MSSIIQQSFLGTKHCCRCNQWLPLTAFYAAKNRPDGRNPWCIECKKKYDQSKKAKWTENARTRLQFEGGVVCPHCKQWKPISAYGVNAGAPRGIQSHCQECRYPATRKKVLEKHKEKYWNDPDKYRKAKRIDHHKHREERNRKRLLYRAEHIDKERARIDEWFRANPDRVRFHAKQHAHQRRAWKGSARVRYRDWQAMCDWFGNTCLKCGTTGKLTMDHVIPLSRGGTHSIDNVQPLCMTCNHSKFTKSTDYRDPDRLTEFLKSIGH